MPITSQKGINPPWNIKSWAYLIIISLKSQAISAQVSLSFFQHLPRIWSAPSSAVRQNYHDCPMLVCICKFNLPSLCVFYGISVLFWWYCIFFAPATPFGNSVGNACLHLPFFGALHAPQKALYFLCKYTKNRSFFSTLKISRFFSSFFVFLESIRAFYRSHVPISSFSIINIQFCHFFPFVKIKMFFLQKSIRILHQSHAKKAARRPKSWATGRKKPCWCAH